MTSLLDRNESTTRSPGAPGASLSSPMDKPVGLIDAPASSSAVTSDMAILRQRVGQTRPVLQLSADLLASLWVVSRLLIGGRRGDSAAFDA